MLKKALIGICATIAALSPTAAFAFDPPTPPWQTDPGCDARARQWAARYGPVGSPDYNWAFYEYYYEWCPIQD